MVGFSCAAAARGAIVNLAAGGTYDSTTNANVVDFNANGNALSATGGADVAGFTANVASAFATNRGGVVDFDTPSTVFGISASADTLNVLYGGGKSLRVTLSRDARTANYGSASALSGTNEFDLPDLQENAQSITLTFGPVTGGSAGEALTALGFSAVARNGVASTVGMSVTYDDSTTSTTLSRALAGTQGASDTFYGFVAPPGRTIASLTVTRSARIPFDDLGFITNAAPTPEPAAAGLLAVGAGALFARRRRRAARAGR